MGDSRFPTCDVFMLFWFHVQMVMRRYGADTPYEQLKVQNDSCIDMRCLQVAGVDTGKTCGPAQYARIHIFFGR